MTAIELNSMGWSDPELSALGILIALPDSKRRSQFASCFLEHGFRIWEAESGLEALSTFFDHTGDLTILLVDADFFDLPGPTFLKRIRTHFPGIPCIFLSERPAHAKLEGETIRTLPNNVSPAQVMESVKKAIR